MTKNIGTLSLLIARIWLCRLHPCRPGERSEDHVPGRRAWPAVELGPQRLHVQALAFGFGDDRPETVLLVNGLGSQMTRWPEAFCEKLVAKGKITGDERHQTMSRLSAAA